MTSSPDAETILQALADSDPNSASECVFCGQWDTADPADPDAHEDWCPWRQAKLYISGLSKS